jgi:8-hydroxy-5-deazaflavin:NADPH oxidoreductase
MKIAVLGTGVVGQTLALAFQRLGHEVAIGTRDPEATRSRDDWSIDVSLQAYGDVAKDADVVVNATNGSGALSALGMVGTETLAGKVVLDVSNPLDFSQGFPPTLTVKDTDSLAEEIQRACPDALVVKTLNTVSVGVGVEPGRVGDGSTTMFVASDHEAARGVAVELLRALGWQDILEFEELSAARGMEMWLPMWVRLMGRLGTPNFNLKLVR